MPQQIIDLSEAVPETIGVRLEKGGRIFEIPGDIPIPDFIGLERAVADLEDPETEGSGSEKLQGLFDRVMAIFRVHQPGLEEEDLPLGPKKLGALIVGIYAGAAEEDGGADPPPAGGTQSTKKSRSKRSASSKS